MFEERICTFIDILGFRELVNKADSDAVFAERVSKTLNVMSCCGEALNDSNLKRVVRFVLESNSGKKIPDPLPEKSSEKIKSTAFSDNLIISSEITLEGSLNHIIAINLLVHKLLSLGFMARGAITIGNLYHDGNTVFGKGLIDAYELESGVAIYPRICASDDVISRIANIEPQNGALAKFFSRDFDGIQMFDYLEEAALRIASYDDPETDWEHMKEYNRRYATRISLTENYIRSITNSVIAKDYKILSKARWLARYFNQSMTTKEYYLPQEIVLPQIS